MGTYKCTKCDATFDDRDDLRKHQFGHLYDAEGFQGLDLDEESLGSILSSHKSALEEFNDEQEAMGANDYTHWIVKNNKGNCVIVPIGQALPPNWTVIHTGTKATCESHFHSTCGQGAGGNKC